MPITFSKEDKQQAVESIQRYFDENMDEPIGNLPAESLLDFITKELGPLVYNRAVRGVQERLQARIAELDVDIHEDEFQYFSTRHPQSRPSRTGTCRRHRHISRRQTRE
jgi:uncharacterized protein (DUF2164 family)